MSTSQRVVMPRVWGVKAGMVRVWVAGKQCDPLVTRGPYLSAFEIRSLYIQRYINSPSLLLLFFTLHELTSG